MSSVMFQTIIQLGDTLHGVLWKKNGILLKRGMCKNLPVFIHSCFLSKQQQQQQQQQQQEQKRNDCFTF